MTDSKPKFYVTPFIELRDDEKYHVVVTALVQKVDWKYEQVHKSIANFDTFEKASKYALDYYNKQKEM